MACKRFAVLGPIDDGRDNFFNDLSAYCASNGFELKIYPSDSSVTDEAAFTSDLNTADAVFCIVDPDAWNFYAFRYWANMIEKAGVKYPVQIMFDYERWVDPDKIVEVANYYSDAILAETGNLEVTMRRFKMVFYNQKRGESCSTENGFTYVKGMDAISAVLK